MFKLLNMSGVSECSIGECAYNSHQTCHAIAITVGDGDQPMCDTFLVADAHSHDKGHAGVGACKVSTCQHNHALECSAGHILVGKLESRVRCMTYLAA